MKMFFFSWKFRLHAGGIEARSLLLQDNSRELRQGRHHMRNLLDGRPGRDYSNQFRLRGHAVHGEFYRRGKMRL